MPITFQNSTNDDPISAAGYLKFLPRATRDTWLGALFIMNARGEPVEFVHSRVRAPRSVMWRAADLELRCLESLCTSMFQACPVVPDILLCLDREVGPSLFGERICLEMPVARISLDESTGEIVSEWVVEPPHNSAQCRLLDSISDRGLLLEPFERAEVGLREVYKDLLQ